MIKVIALKNCHGLYYDFEVSGHAGYAENGFDIVCSAVTVLVFNTINSIETFTEDYLEYSYEPDGGYIKFSLPNIKKNNKPSKETDVLLKSLILGLESIEEEYGNKYLVIVAKEV